MLELNAVEGAERLLENRSDLPLRVAFPVMMNNIFNWLNPNTLDFTSTQVVPR